MQVYFTLSIGLAHCFTVDLLQRWIMAWGKLDQWRQVCNLAHNASRETLEKARIPCVNSWWLFHLRVHCQGHKFLLGIMNHLFHVIFRLVNVDLLSALLV